MMKAVVIGAGLAGSEAAWQLARRGVNVELYEMRPTKMTPAHRTGDFAELVCSNSLRSDAPENAVGLLKAELEHCGSLIMSSARATAVPAGGALAVDRELFSQRVSESLRTHPLIKIHYEEITAVPAPTDTPVIIATGPLTADALATSLEELTGPALSFFDAAAPIVERDSLDFSKLYWASRHGKGDADYLNSPLTEAEYHRFHEELLHAETAEVHGFEKNLVFEGCLPIETMAARGYETMAFGPLKPVGLPHPATGREPYAVVQMRKENLEGNLLNLVGFQTHLKWGEQKRVFRLLPGLENAEFARYGVMHRNTFLNSPRLLAADFSLRVRPDLFFAGQITGVEGYVESTASGLMTALNVWQRLSGGAPLVFPRETALGGLAAHLAGTGGTAFQPMNITFGLLAPLEEKVRGKRERNKRLAARALAVLSQLNLAQNAIL
jgi:methylenetetrahydrofolate--tRNA-(uracil-5-)-methyltransferase